MSLFQERVPAPGRMPAAAPERPVEGRVERPVARLVQRPDSSQAWGRRLPGSYRSRQSPNPI